MHLAGSSLLSDSVFPWLAAGQIPERRSVHAHAAVPQVELIEEVRVDVEEIQRRRIGQPDDFHVAESRKRSFSSAACSRSSRS